MIEIKDLCKSYSEKTVLNRLSLSLENGGIYALVGRNGIGKTTLLNAMVSPHFKDGGESYIDGIKQEEFDAKYRFFYVTDAEMFLNYTVAQYVRLMKRLYWKEEMLSKEKLEYYVRELQLECEWNSYLKECSYGTKKKVYLLGALISGASNLILDEPFNGLDPIVSEKVRKILKEVAMQDKLVLFSSHNLDMICNYADKIIFFGEKGFVTLDNMNDYKALYEKFEEICGPNSTGEEQ